MSAVRPVLTLDALDAADEATFVSLLDGIYEHSPWVAAAAFAYKPFASVAALKHAMSEAVRAAGADAHLALVRAHPELAGKAAIAGALTAESTGEQSKAGLNLCSPEEFATLHKLNADYNARFGFPFIVAVRGPRGTGLTRTQIIEVFTRRLAGHRDFELAEALRNIDRIAEIRLDEKFGVSAAQGELVWDWAEQLSVHSDPGFKEQGQLTVTYLTEAHRACAAQLSAWMTESGFDEVSIDAVGNVVGVYHAADAAAVATSAAAPTADGPRATATRAPRASDSTSTAVASSAAQALPARARRLLTGSHYDTVRNGGKYDGRLGILVPMACVRALHAAGRRLPYALEVVGFAEEEGQRYKATFLGSGALVGQFDPAWLDQADADGVTMRDAMRAAGLPGTLEAITQLRRDPAAYLGFVEVHIEQGPVLNEMSLPLGVVSSINGSVRYVGEVRGVASHAGTTPMNRRRDAASAVAELALYAEARASSDEDSVATVGMLDVPGGSINVVPGRCRFSLDLRAPNDAQRDRLVADVLAQLQRIAERRRVSFTLEETMRASAAPSDAAWQARWAAAVGSLGLPVFMMPSGAGHDAMKLHEVMPQAMLFVRGENSGISHNPLESTTSDDMQLAVEAFDRLMMQLAGQ